MATGAFLPPVVTKLSMEISDFVAGVAKAKAALKGLPTTIDVDVNVNTAGAIAQLKAFEQATNDAAAAQQLLAAAVNNTNSHLSAQGANLAILNPLLSSMSRRLTTATARQNAFHAAVSGTNGALLVQSTLMGATNLNGNNNGNNNGGGGGWWGWLTNRIPLFGGAFGNRIPLLSYTHAWELALSSATEFTIALVSASIALGAAFAAMEPAAGDIYNRLTAIHDVAVSLNGGASIPPLGGWFENLQHAVAGNTIGAYGGLLNLLQGQANGKTATTIQEISSGLDTWVAKLDLFAKTQNNANGILQHGMGYAGQFEMILNNLGKTFLNLMQAEPGTAHFLMDFIEGISSGLQWISHFDGFVKLALGMHAIISYGGTLYTVISRILGRLPIVGRYITAFMANPAIATATIAIALLAYTWDKATRSVGGYISAQNQALLAMTPEGAANAIPGMIRGINGQIQGLSVSKIMPDFNLWSNAIPGFGDYLKQLGHDVKTTFSPSAGIWGQLGGAAHFIKDLFTPGSGAHEAYITDLANYRGQIQSLNGDYLNLFATGAKFIPQGYSMQQAFSLMALAGVKANDTYAVMVQKVENLIKGYGDLGNNAGMLTNSINAVNFAAEQQNSKITAVTGGWSAFIGMITGGADGFATFEQQMIGINQAMGKAAATVSIANGKVSVSTAGQAGSVGGITTAQLQNLQAFTSGISDASTELNNLYTLDSAAALGTRGVNMLAQAGKDMVIQFLPMAQGSKLLTAQLYALAQQGGYKGADSLHQMALWAGNAKNPVANLLGITSQFTVAAGNLGIDVKNLAEAIDPTMTSAMNNAIVQASGGTKALEDWATAVLKGYNNSKQLSTGAQGLWQEIHLVYQNTGQARDMFDAYNIRLGITRDLSNKLFTDMQNSGGRMTAAVMADLQAIQNYLDNMHGKTLTVNIATNGVAGVTQTPSYGPYTGGYRSGSTAHGYAMGTGGAARGWAWVGEQGPELVRFSGGERVVPNSVSRGYAAGTPDNTVHEINVYLDGKRVYRTTQREAVNTQRRTGSNGLSKRTR